MKKQFFFLLFTLFTLPVFALRIESGKDVVITEDIHEDIYVAAGNVSIRGKVYGDVIAAGGKIVLSDSIMGDVLAGGGELIIDGWVGDDVRVAGGTVHINEGVHGDLIVTGGEVSIASNATIDGDLLAASGDIDLDGTVRGNAKIGAGQLKLNGLVQGKLDFRGGDFDMNGTVGGPCTLSASDLDIGQSARFEGNVAYWTEKGEEDFKGALASGATATFDSSLKKNMRSDKGVEKSGRGFLGSIWYFFAVGLLAWLLQFLFGRKFLEAAKLGERETFEMVLRGFLFFIATPVLAIMLLITVVGIPIGLLLGGCYAILLALANVLTAAVLAQWLQDNRGMQWTLPVLALVTAGIALLLKALTWIPFLGWLVKFGLICVVFGALYTLIRASRNRNTQTYDPGL